MILEILWREQRKFDGNIVRSKGPMVHGIATSDDVDGLRVHRCVWQLDQSDSGRTSHIESVRSVMVC